VGAFFTNVQVRFNQANSNKIRTTISAAIRQGILQQGFIEMATTEQDPDRLVFLGPAGPEPWVAVYDEATEDQDERGLRRLTAMLILRQRWLRARDHGERQR
jgi:hypothetical protein